MPRVKNSKDLKDYSRTRQWQLKKQFININTRRNQLEHHDQRDHFIMVQGDEELLLNEPMQEIEAEEAINTPMLDVDIPEALVQHGDEVETEEAADEPMQRIAVSEDIVEHGEEEPTEEAVDELVLEVDPLEGTGEYGEEETEDEEEESEADMGDEENHENELFDEQNRMWEDDGDEPLYDGATISVAETMIAILTFVLKFNLTGTCLSALLKLIALIIPATPRFKKTIYKFHKFFNNMKSPLVRHYYCSSCYSQFENDNGTCDCTEAANIAYFLEIPIISQLQSFFLRPHFWDDLDPRFRSEGSTSISDIYDGHVYKNHADGLLSNRNRNITFMFYTDGAPAFKSSKCKVWPVYLIINELPYNKRILKENIIVAGIWFGPENPKPNLFLQPFHAEIVKLRRGVCFKIPIFTNPQKVKALLICGTCDIPAKADFMNHNHHNGFYGCTLCYSPGYNISGSNFGNTHIYPFEGSLELRTIDKHQQNVEEAHNEGQKVFGVKGPSILFSIIPNAINGMAIDIMHCVFNGVVPKLVSLWFDSSMRYERFSLHAQKVVVDNRLLQIQPISSVSRMPRSISDSFSHWKASEWRNFFFYYSIPILEDIMTKKYFEHYTQLVQAIYILSKNDISPEQLCQAEELLISFVGNFQALYDARFMSINIHLLMHLTESVRNTGPTWVSTCFPYEDLNGKLLKYIHGTNHVDLQIGSSVAYSIIISNVVATLNDDSEVKKFCSSLLTTGKRLKKTEQICEKVYTVGKIKNYNNVSGCLIEILEKSGFRIPGLKVGTFRGIKKNGHIINNINYTRSRLYASYGVLYEEHNSSELKIGFIESFFKLCYCNDDCQSNSCEAVYIAIVKDGVTNNTFSTSVNMIINNDVDNTNYERIPLPHIHRFRGNANRKLILVNSIKSVCFTVKVNGKIYVGELINDVDFKGAD